MSYSSLPLQQQAKGFTYKRHLISEHWIEKIMNESLLNSTFFVLVYDPIETCLNKDYINSAIQPYIVLKFDSEVSPTFFSKSMIRVGNDRVSGHVNHGPLF